MTVTKDVSSAAMPYLLLAGGLAVAWLFRNQIGEALVSTVPGWKEASDIATWTQTPVTGPGTALDIPGVTGTPAISPYTIVSALTPGLGILTGLDIWGQILGMKKT